MTPGQEAAVDDLAAAFGQDRVSVEDLGGGRAWVTLASVELGPGWNAASTPLSTVLEPSYPTPAPYPFYAADGLARSDGGAVAGLTASVEILGRRASQLSVKKDGQTALAGLGGHFMAVAAWLRSR